jgi:hypothetical protein
MLHSAACKNVNMTSNLKTAEFRASTGERFAILLGRDDGLPLYWPNLFSTTQLRSRSLATNTIGRALRNIALIYEWSHIKGIDLDHRLVHGSFLSLAETELLAHDLRLQKHILVSEDAKVRRLNLRNWESVRRKQGHPVRLVVSAGDACARFADVVRYLEWHAKRRISLMSQPVEASHFRTMTEAAIGHLRAVAPKKGVGDSDARRTGMLPAERALLLEAIEPNSASNPFRGNFQRLRNYL